MIDPALLDPARIMVAGDWHGNSAWAEKGIHRAREQGCDVIVHVGDFGWWPGPDGDHYLRHLQHNLEDCGIILYWIDGNHENHDSIQEWLEATDSQPWSDKRYPNIIHLPRGYRWQWWNQTWLAMGGAHSVDRHLRTEGRSWWPGEHITDEQVQRGISGGEVDIMICHDVPAGVEIPGIDADEKLDSEKSFWPIDQIRAANTHRRQLARVVDAVKPKYLFSGHYHVRHQTRRGLGGTLVNILDCDGSTLDRNTLFLNPPEGWTIPWGVID